MEESASKSIGSGGEAMLTRPFDTLLFLVLWVPMTLRYVPATRDVTTCAI